METGMSKLAERPDKQRFEHAVRMHQLGQFADSWAVCARMIAEDPRRAEVAFLAGVAAAALGDGRFTVGILRAAARLNPESSELYGLLGVQLLRIGQFEEALTIFDHVIALRAQCPDTLANRGIALSESQRVSEAALSFRRSVFSQSDLVGNRLNFGIALAKMADHHEALSAFDSVLCLKPDHDGALQARADTFRNLGHHDRAIRWFDAALTVAPSWPVALINRGMSFLERGEADIAAKSFSHAIAADPQSYEAYNNHGLALQHLGQLNSAARSYQAATTLRNDYFRAWHNLGRVLREAGSLGESVSSLNRALQLSPDSAEALNQIGLAFVEKMSVLNALLPYERAIKIKPHYAEARVGGAMARLLIGDYTKAWPDYEYRWELKTSKPLGYRGIQSRVWNGHENLSGKTILLSAEQGLGDVLQCLRYIPLLAQRQATIIVEAPTALARLIGGIPGVSKIFPQGTPPPPHDFYSPVMSLPCAFGTTLESIPFDGEAYLHALAEDTDYWRKRLNDLSGKERRLRVGVVWSGGTRADQPETRAINERRNVPLALFSRYLDISGVDFFSLQKGEPAESELYGRENLYWRNANFINDAALLHDFAVTAGLIENLDLVISVDTSTAHLAAAMGKPTWILNRYDTCWRWLIDREDSPWYASVRLYRQGPERSWVPVLERVRADLQASADLLECPSILPAPGAS